MHYMNIDLNFNCIIYCLIIVSLICFFTVHIYMNYNIYVSFYSISNCYESFWMFENVKYVFCRICYLSYSIEWWILQYWCILKYFHIVLLVLRNCAFCNLLWKFLDVWKFEWFFFKICYLSYSIEWWIL